MNANGPNLSKLDRDAVDDLGLIDDRIESDDSPQHDEAVTPIMSAGKYATPSHAGLTPRSCKRVVRK